MTRKRIQILIFIFLGVCLLGLGAYLYTNQVSEAGTYKLTDPDSSVHVVTLTAKGFKPERLIIRKGDQVIFESAEDRPYWPASDVHPTHEAYPEFDAKKPIVPPENYEFVFDKPGVWSYHDHIAHTLTGVIYVLETGKESIAAIDYAKADCTTLDGNERTMCWDEHIREVARTQGLDAAFDFFISLYDEEEGVEKSCHEWIHALGEAAYEIYAQGGEVQLRAETSWCSYGYYHGFINGLIWDTGSLEKVMDFCNTAVAKYGDALPQIKSNCFHGTGHAGVDLFFDDPAYWGDFNKIAKAGFKQCDDLFGDDPLINECYGGVIHGIRFSMRNNIHGMNFDIVINQKDPYYYCRDLDEKYHRACYSDFASMFWDVFNGDVKQAVAYIVNEHIPNDAVTAYSLLKVSAAWVEHDLATGEHQANVEACRTVQGELFAECFLGIGIGFVQHGEPDNMHEKAFAFCRSDYLTPAERTTCFTQMPDLLVSSYSPERIAQACSTLAPSERYGRCAL